MSVVLRVNESYRALVSNEISLSLLFSCVLQLFLTDDNSYMPCPIKFSARDYIIRNKFLTGALTATQGSVNYIRLETSHYLSPSPPPTLYSCVAVLLLVFFPKNKWSRTRINLSRG